jgi:hypothetical protein
MISYREVVLHKGVMGCQTYDAGGIEKHPRLFPFVFRWSFFALIFMWNPIKATP